MTNPKPTGNFLCILYVVVFASLYLPPWNTEAKEGACELSLLEHAPNTATKLFAATADISKYWSYHYNKVYLLYRLISVVIIQQLHAVNSNATKKKDKQYSIPPHPFARKRRHWRR